MRIASRVLVSGSNNFLLVRDLVYSLDDGTAVGGSALSFFVDATGKVSGAVVPAGAGSAVNGALVLGNITIAVDPGAYTGQYRLGGGDFLSGRSNVVQIPGLVTNVNAGGQAAYFTPATSGITPPSVVLTIGAQSFTFSFSLTPATIVSGFTAQVATFVAAAAVPAPLGAGLGAGLQAALSIAAVSPAAAGAIVTAEILVLNSALALGLITPAANAALVASLNLLRAAF